MSSLADLEAALDAVLTAQESMLDRLDLLDGGGASSDPDAGDDTTEALDDLPSWVEWLIDTYLLDLVIPTGWDDQPAIANELRALHAAHKAAYGSKAGPWDQLTWHDHLARALDRIDPSHKRGYTQRHADRALAED